MKRTLIFFLLHVALAASALAQSTNQNNYSGNGSAAPGTVTHTSGPLNAGLPVIGNGSGDVSVGTKTGNTTLFPTFTGPATPTRCVDTDANGNLVITVADCGVASSMPFSGLTAPTGNVTIGIGSYNVSFTGSGIFSAPGIVATGTAPISMTAQADPTSLPVTSWNLYGNTGITTSFAWRSPPAECSVAGVPLLSAAASHINNIICSTLSNPAGTEIATSTGVKNNGNLASWNSTGDAQDASIVAANVTTNSTGFTTNAVPKGSAAHTLTNSAILDNGTIVQISESILLTTNTGYTIAIANEGTTGTTVNKLAKLSGAPSKAIITTAGDLNGAVGIVSGGAGTSASAQVAQIGIAACVVDGNTTAGNYVQISATVNGDCHDAGSSFPASNQVIGRFLASNGGGAGQLVAVLLFSPSR